MVNITPVRFARRKADLESLWLVTFADLMVQLMAFFALLYSFSVSDQTKLQQALTSIQKALGVKGQMAVVGDGILPGSQGLDPAKAEDLEKQLSTALVSEGPDVGSRLRIVSFRGSLIFEEGSATLTTGSDVLLTRLSELALRYQGFTLVCEGHAAQGEKGRGMDALELSSQRAMAAQRYLIGIGLSPARLTSEARGDSQPEGDGASPEGRALERRVTFRFQRVAER
ncbi:flagellar motor protein MotB [Geothrix sp. PMB-07]|uniref:OmpA/MotB family protein n=1 Tax=Geothrix sp. PMB-07 TaxID=3068640 RepID=UPI0027406635|nr:flagellar motor protein MotB [Geothrix sp. PMB-07]WLT30500.1 flagellar motor protein MotB [Geothrix sp. PMB-07]